MTKEEDLLLHYINVSNKKTSNLRFLFQKEQ